MLSDMLTEERQMFVRNGEMQMYLTLGSGILRTLYHMLQRRRTGTVAVLMEQEQALGQLAIVHILQEVAYGFLSLFALQFGSESELRLMRQEDPDSLGLLTVVEVLEEPS